LIMLSSIGIIVVNGFNWGLDFTGGIVTEVKLDSNIKATQISKLLSATSEQEVSVISAGEPGRWILRYAKIDNAGAGDIKTILAPLTNDVEVLNSSIVGSQIGQELAEQGGLALLAAMLCILAYLSFRFEWRLASGALLALFHDVIFVLAFFSLTQMEFNLTILAAVLAILGYSLNDSIVIADRVREVLIAKPKMAIDKVCSSAVKATFSRTMITSGTTLFTVGALWVMGGAPLQGFSIAMFLGIMIGTVSSVSVGTCLPEYLKVNAEHYKVEPISETP
ncbi:protein translocase subunit SecF, partial [Shewanella sp. 0m-11]